MVLAMAVLLFQFPAAPAPANAAHATLRDSAAAFRHVDASNAVQLADNAAAAGPSAARVGENVPAAGSSASVTRAAAPSPAVTVSTSDHPELSDSSKFIIHPMTPRLNELTGASLSDSYLPPPPGFRPPNEIPMTHHRLWMLLSAAEHSSAAYDAWSTRYALSNGRVEADPLMRPFAGSAAIYPAIQVIPFGLDYVAHRLQRNSGWARHIWWVPQSLATATFLFSGSYNLAHTP